MRMGSWSSGKGRIDFVKGGPREFEGSELRVRICKFPQRCSIVDTC